MACTGCGKRGRGTSSSSGSRKVSAFGPGTDVKLRYLGSSEGLEYFEGAATRQEYVVGGRINLITADSRDLATGVSWSPGLLEMTGDKGSKLFEIHVPLAEEIEAEAKAKARQEEAWANAEALALPAEESKPKRHKAKAKQAKAKPDGESTLPGD